MSEFDNSNRGVLFKNDNKTSDKAPDYKGKIDVGGVEYELAAWIRTSAKSGAKFMSLSVKLKEQRQEDRGSAPARIAGSKNTPIDLNDEIPFAPEFR